MSFDMVERGAYLGYSADGIRWRREPKPFWRTPVDAASWGDDTVKSMIYDKLKNKWVMYRRVTPQESERLVAMPGDEDWQQPDFVMRVMGYAESENLSDWGNYRIIMIPAAADVEFYGMTCYNYEQVYVGYLWVFHGALDTENIDIQLVTSRDGVGFTRCCRRETFLPAGPRQYFDYEICPGYQAEPIIVNDEVFLYYEACNYDHGGDDFRRTHSVTTAGLATFPRDLFVSLQTGLPQVCRLVTRPFTVEYPDLFINAATWGEGSIRAEVLTRDWKVIEGFSQDESNTVKGNALAHRVGMEESQRLCFVARQEVRLKFSMADARFHAMVQETDDRKSGILPGLTSHEAEYSSASVIL
ncbi:MAG: hypothetical protein AUJ92_19255 [Armatimonadetes bacterium CG2_30_59_28]|nr:hypothetical protein [Armatimonadota bacterium]OIO90213.1 MAG: hypothetical protein AUJ92_19255 [Armatimonadetes bacterium CG2_30_59_28]PIU61184.1 MAG: hypothetical protein COS85_21540 [Armatimonadetes bacterium CG07_land_8_20_14_0_80_59_28]PIY44621.1 MAG: hypothetical protein COZ05_07620 [Armatimonadetes bacterium CG_4_10_14_3_um_filter_59_10]PJB78045.1 MAG: hypothetical protein CO095_00955 [Armatimonadetes bacterium CG_4_9_14_3_um_filter_58_7]